MKNKNYTGLIIMMLGIIYFLPLSSFAQEPYRVGTTTANFLEIGFGSAGSSMGDAYVCLANDLSSAYWNPAGLSFMNKSEVQFLYQPWLVDINTSFSGIGIVMPSIGTFALSILHTGYGEMQVTTMEMQEGTGENFSANDYSVNLSFGKQLANWFAFGVTGKYIASRIWHTNANAFALDLGVIVKTQFFSVTGNRDDGMKIGMSIANYGTRMQFDGMDMLQPIDILPNEEGNYRDVAGTFKSGEWELPLIFRIGIAIDPIVVGPHRLTIAVDALHPNNNTESVNVGAQYELSLPSYGDFYLRSGYKGLFMENSEYGLSFGGGTFIKMMNNMGLKIEYAYRTVGLLGNTHSYTIGILF